MNDKGIEVHVSPVRLKRNPLSELLLVRVPFEDLSDEDMVHSLLTQLRNQIVSECKQVGITVVVEE